MVLIAKLIFFIFVSRLRISQTKKENYCFLFFLSLSTTPFYWSLRHTSAENNETFVEYQNVHQWFQVHLKVSFCSGNSLGRIFLIQKAALCHVTSAFLCSFSPPLRLFICKVIDYLRALDPSQIAAIPQPRKKYMSWWFYSNAYGCTVKKQWSNLCSLFAYILHMKEHTLDLLSVRITKKAMTNQCMDVIITRISDRERRGYSSLLKYCYNRRGSLC